MITLNLQRIARQKGILKPNASLRALGINYGMASYLMKGQIKMLKLADIEKICLAWHITPNDLLQWTQSPADAALPANHPLAILNRTTPETNINQLLINASPQKLEEVERLLKGEE